MTSKKDETYKNLRYRIITHELKPMESLNDKILMDHYDIGRTPLREVMLQLQRDGLIQRFSRSGTVVSPVDIHIYKQTIEIRMVLEGLAGELAAERISEEQLEALRQILKQVRELGEKDHVSTIIVYPEHFIVNNGHTSGGIYHDDTSVLEGQSANGTVVISWQDIKHDISQQKKENVIIHEFAHELDFEDGLADGTPILEGSRYKIWSKVFSKAFDTLKDQLNYGEVSERSVLLGSYALTNEAEFFAVCSERFFETPQAFKMYFPNIYQELKLFYRLDTQQLFKDL